MAMKLLSQIKPGENEDDFSHLLYYGDYACVNFLVMYAEKSHLMKKEEYPSELKEEFGISDARLFHRKMIADGYLEPSSIEERLSDCPMEKVVEIATKLDLPSSGTKEEILQRLSLNSSLEELSQFIPQKDIYSISEKGNQYVEKEKNLLDLYQNRDQYHVSYNEYVYVQSNHPELSYQDVLWQVMNARFQKNVEDTNYQQVKDEYLNMYELLKDEQKTVDALNALLTYFFMDLNVFADTYFYIEEFKRSSKSVPEFLSEVPVPVLHMNPEIPGKIAALKESYQSKAAESISKNNVSYYINTAQFLSILDQIFNGTFSTEAAEAEINERIPKALDHILRNER